MPNHQQEQVSRIVCSYLKELGVFHSEAEVTLVLKSHPEYPSLWSIAQTLNYFGVKSNAFSADFDGLQKINAKVIIHLRIGDGIFVILEEISNNAVTYYDVPSRKKKYLSREHFLKIWSGILIVGEKSERPVVSDQSNYLAKIAIGSFLMCFVFLYGYFFPNVFCLTSFLLNLIGYLTAGALLLHQIGYSNSLIDHICISTKFFNCNQFIRQSVLPFFREFSLITISFVFFLAGTFLFVFCPFLSTKNHIFFIWQWVMAAGSPFVLAAFTYQMVVKKWCPLCLAMATTFVLQFILLLQYWQQPVNLELTVEGGTFVCILVFFSTIFYWLTKGYFTQRQMAEKNLEKNLSLKRRSFILAGLFHTQPHIRLDKELISLGIKNAQIVITTVLSTSCNPCKEVALFMIKLIKKYPENIQWKLFFAGNISDKFVVGNELLLHLIMLSMGNNDSAQQFLYDWARNKSIHFLKKKYALNSIDEKAIAILSNSTKEIKKQKIDLTPFILINDIKLPPEYSIKDIPYFLLDEELLLNIFLHHPALLKKQE